MVADRVSNSSFFGLQEGLLSVVGSTLLIYSGVVALDAYDHPELGSPAGNALGGLSIAAGILLIINLLTLAVTLRLERLYCCKITQPTLIFG